MKSKFSNIALIYFSQSAELESRRKRWFRSVHRNRNLSLANSLVLQSSQVVYESGLAVFHYHEGNQKGNSFGERLANAFAEVFELGYQAVVAVGNDIPELYKTDWQFVVRELTDGRCVLGPSSRGGSYLIGLTRAAFVRKSFQILPWQTRQLFAALKQFCSSDACPAILEQLADVNSFDDILALFRKRSLKKCWRLLFASLLSGWKSFQKVDVVASDFYFTHSCALRAPPFLFHFSK